MRGAVCGLAGAALVGGGGWGWVWVGVRSGGGGGWGVVIAEVGSAMVVV